VGQFNVGYLENGWKTQAKSRTELFWTLLGHRGNDGRRYLLDSTQIKFRLKGTAKRRPQKMQLQIAGKQKVKLPPYRRAQTFWALGGRGSNNF